MATIPEPVGVSAHVSTHPAVLGTEPGTPESPYEEKSIDIPSGATSDTSSEEIFVDRAAERALVWRLDLVFLFAGFLGYVFKYLDQTNISNAYVSGMKEDLSLFGNELNLFTTFFNAGYIIMLFPSCVIVSHYGPGKWLPTCELMWGVLTCCLSLSKDAKTIYGLRFLIGLFEGSAWPGYFTIISQWYLPHEVALRMSLYNVAQPVGAMLSGALQGAISTNLDGHFGRTGWQWAFIVNASLLVPYRTTTNEQGVCTIFVALLAYFALPGYPDRPNPLAKWYLRPQDYETAILRSKKVKKVQQRPITIKSFLRAFTFWKLWVFAIAWPFGGNTVPSQFFNLYLKSLKLPNGKPRLQVTVGQLNYIPIGGQAIAFVTEILFSLASDRTGRRLELLLLHSAINIASQVILIVRPANIGAHMAGYFLNFFGFASMMTLCAWATNHLQGEPEVRTILFSTGTTIAYISNMFLPIVAFPAKQAPHWKIGSKLYLGFMVAMTFLFVAIHFLLKWDVKRKGIKVVGN